MNTRRTLQLLTILVLATCTTTAFADTWYVDLDNTSGTEDGTTTSAEVNDWGLYTTDAIQAKMVGDIDFEPFIGGEGATCGPSTLFGQLPGMVGGTEWRTVGLFGYADDISEVDEAFEYISGTEGTISAIRWWGFIQTDEDPSLKTVDKQTISPFPYDITFYEDNDGVPSMSLETVTVYPTVTQSDLILIDAEEEFEFNARRFDVTLDSPLTLPPGTDWIGIRLFRHNQSEGLGIIWLSSAEGDGGSYYRNSVEASTRDFDLSLCLTGEASSGGEVKERVKAR